MQQSASAKASAASFFILLGISDDRSASTRAVGPSGSQPQADWDENAPNHASKQEKKARQGTQERTSTGIETAATALPIDETGCLPITGNTELQNCAVMSGVSASGGAGSGASPDSQNSRDLEIPSSGKFLSIAAQDVTIQIERAGQNAIGDDNEVTLAAEPAMKTLAEDDSDADQFQNGGVETSQPDPGARNTPLSLALEGVVAGSQALSCDANPGQMLTKASPGTRTGATSAASVGAVITKSQAKAGAAEPLSASASGNQSSQVSTERHQADVAPFTAPPMKTSDAVTSPIVTTIPHGVSASSPAGTSTQAGASLHRSQDAVSQNQFDGTDDRGASGVNAARVIQTMSESQMCVGMHSVDFGNISIRTSVSQQQLVAQITVDRHDLGTAISSHIPLAQAKLGNDYGIHASIEVNQSGASFDGDRQNSQQQPQQQAVRSPQFQGGAGEAETIGLAAIPGPVVGDACRLDIRA